MPMIFGSEASEDPGRRRQGPVSRGVEGLERTVRLAFGSAKSEVLELMVRLVFGSAKSEVSELTVRLVFGLAESEALELRRRRTRDSRRRTFRLDGLKFFGLRVLCASS
jgi:hypothetical protein